jgi:cytoskeletal protein CcmA (bactofilin family)
MLGRNKKLRQIDTLIGQGTTIEGQMKCQSSLRIDGKFHGEIEATGNVVIGEHGIAESNIHAREVIIAGKVLGDVTTKGHLMIMSSGQLHGNYAGPSIIIHEGAVFNGESRIEKIEPLSMMQESESSTSHKNNKQAG